MLENGDQRLIVLVAGQDNDLSLIALLERES